jgi:site-specific DNA recombinase
VAPLRGLCHVASLEKELARSNGGLRKLVGEVARNGAAADRMADLQERIRVAERRATEVREELIAIGRSLVDEREAVRALALFDPVWDRLSPREQVRVLQLLVERVNYDGNKQTVSVTFHPTGIKSLVEETRRKEMAG